MSRLFKKSHNVKRGGEIGRKSEGISSLVAIIMLIAFTMIVAGILR